MGSRRTTTNHANAQVVIGLWQRMGVKQRQRRSVHSPMIANLNQSGEFNDTLLNSLSPVFFFARAYCLTIRAAFACLFCKY